jgi:hypothetical protein
MQIPARFGVAPDFMGSHVEPEVGRHLRNVGVDLHILRHAGRLISGGGIVVRLTGTA